MKTYSLLAEMDDVNSDPRQQQHGNESQIETDRPDRLQIGDRREITWRCAPTRKENMMQKEINTEGTVAADQ